MSDNQNRTLHTTTAECKGQHSLSDMKQANGEAALVRKPVDMSSGREYEKCRFAFFPGCQLGAAEPEIVIKAYDSILFQHPDTAIFLRCCGMPAKLAGEEDAFTEGLKAIQDQWESLGKPTLITACTSCMELLKKELPQISTITIYEFLRDSGISGGCNSVDYSLLSSHSGADGGASDDIIRELAEGMGVKLHTEGEGSYPYITDCIDCRDAIKRSGKDAVHILELIYGMGDSNTHMIHEHDHGHDEGQSQHDTAESIEANGSRNSHGHLADNGQLSTKTNITDQKQTDLPETAECDGNCADCTSLCSGYSPTPPAALPTSEERLANRIELKETLLALFWNEI